MPQLSYSIEMYKNFKGVTQVCSTYNIKCGRLQRAAKKIRALYIIIMAKSDLYKKITRSNELSFISYYTP